MAKKASSATEKTNIRRITASDDKPKKQAAAANTPTKKPVKAKSTDKKSTNSTKKTKVVQPKRDINEKTKNPFIAFGNYVRGAWHELKQVRWPTRSATWKMTLAVLLFSAVFVVLILLLDLGFNQLFELILR